MDIFSWYEFAAASADEVVGKVQPGGILACHNTGPRRRADGTGCISIGKTHTALCKLVDIRRFVEAAAITADVFEAHVVDEKENEIRFSS